MICRILSNVTSKLSDFNLLLESSLKATKQDFSLSWFKSINQRSNWTLIVFIRKMNELTVYKLFIPNFGTIINHSCVWIITIKPIFTVFNFFLAKNKLDCLIVLPVNIKKLNFMFSQILEIISRLFISWCSQTFVILDSPCFYVLNALSPTFKVIHCVESNRIVTFKDF